ncbi:MAG: hypothetical protein ACO3ND_02920 [Opitutales bacterium]
MILAPIEATTTIGYADRADRRLSLRRALRLCVSRAGKEIRRFAIGMAEGFPG